MAVFGLSALTGPTHGGVPLRCTRTPLGPHGTLQWTRSSERVQSTETTHVNPVDPPSVKNPQGAFSFSKKNSDVVD